MKKIVFILFTIILLGCDKESIIGPRWHNDYEKHDGIIVTDENGQRYMLEYVGYGTGQARGGNYEIKVERFHDAVNILGDSVIVKRFIYDYMSYY